MMLGEPKDWIVFNAENFAKLDPALRDAAVDMLREELSGNAAAIREKIAENPQTWWAPYHFMWGMAVRNLLRERGFGEEQFMVDNIDDYYVSLVEAAVA